MCIRDRRRVPRRAVGPHLAQRVPGEHRERGPDQAEAGPAGGRHRLVEDGDADQELEHRRQVLQQPEHGQRHPYGRRAEEQQRDRGDHPAEHQQPGVPPAVRAGHRVPEGAASADLQVDQVAEGEREHEGALRRQALQPAQPDLLLQQAVGGEGEREGERDPRQPPVGDGQHGDGEGADAHRRPLRDAQPLLEHQDAEGDGDQGVDEVAEAGLDDVPGVDGPDVDAPVDRDDGGRAGQHGEPAGLAQQRAYPAPVPLGDEQQDHRDEGPDHPVGQDVVGGAGLQQRPEQGEEPPDAVGREAVPEASAVVLLVCLWHGRVPSRARVVQRP